MSFAAFDLLPLRQGDTVILDTDISSDCDDAGALALLIDGCRKTGASLGAVINDTNNRFASGTIDAILSYYGVEALIGQTEDVGFETDALPSNIRYNKQVAERFSKRFGDGVLDVRSAKDVYGCVLSDAVDKSVVLITIGFLNTAAEALRLYPMLFERKIRCVVSMAGNFKSPKDPEWNVLRQPVAAKYFLENCPVPIVFDGFELGHSFKTGFSALQDENPVSMAYALHGNGWGASYDPCAVDIAVCGFGRDWMPSECFDIEVLENGTLTITPDTDGKRCSARFADMGAKERVRSRMNTILQKGNGK